MSHLQGKALGTHIMSHSISELYKGVMFNTLENFIIQHSFPHYNNAVSLWISLNLSSQNECHSRLHTSTCVIKLNYTL